MHNGVQLSTGDQFCANPTIRLSHLTTRPLTTLHKTASWICTEGRSTVLRNSSLSVFMALCLCAPVCAQETASRGNRGGVPQNTQSQPAAQGQQRGTPRIAPGSVIPVQLTKSIDAKKAKTGDAVEAKVTQDLKAESGEVIVPKDTKFVGHVTEAQPRTKEQKESQVGIAFDHAVMKNGGDVSMPLSVQAVISPTAGNG